MHHRFFVTLGSIMLFIGAACGSDHAPGGAGTSSGATTQACTPGTQIVCACGGGLEGAQRCLPDGSGFGACESCSTSGTGTGGGSGTTAGAGGSTTTGGGGGTTTGAGGAGTATLQGAVAKGPFVIGSSVTVSVVDAQANPSGDTFATQTLDNAGSFGLANVPVGGVALRADGFYYDEVRGDLSKAPITLHGFEALTGGTQPTFINVITHLAHNRVHFLAGQGVSLAAAITQAEGELVTALGIGGAGFTLSVPGASLDELGGDDDANAYLLAVSAIFVQAAIDLAGPDGPVDAKLQQLLDTAAASLAPSGTLDPALIASLLTAEAELDVDLIEDLLARYLTTLGVNATIPDLDRVVDSDGDGYPNKVDTCALLANPNQAVVPPGVVCRVKRRTLFETNNAQNLVLGDLDGDGYPDAVFAQSGVPMPFIRLGGPGGHLGPRIPLVPPPFYDPSRLVDIDGDGHVDIVSATEWPVSSADSAWAKGDGAGSFGPAVPFDQGIVSGIYRGGVLAKLSGTLRDDLLRVWTSGQSSPSFLCFNPGGPGGVFGASTLTPLPASFPAIKPGQNAQSVRIYADDFDHDGKLDGYVVWGNHVLFVKGQGGSSFGPYLDNVILETRDTELTDLDGDGNVDLVFTSSIPGIFVAWGDGTGALLPPVNVLNVSAFTMVVADTGGDGRAEILFTDSKGQVEVIAYVNSAFTPPQTLRVTPRGDDPALNRLMTADLDANGTQDLVVSGNPASLGPVLFSLLFAP